MVYFKLGLSILLGAACTLLRQYVVLITIVSAVIVLDCITGLIKARIAGAGWNSHKGIDGFWKKISSIIALSFGIFIDFFIPMALGVGLGIELPLYLPFALIVSVYILFNELISICENIYEINPKAIPKFISNMLEVSGKNTHVHKW